jgi:hypothetical protein
MIELGDGGCAQVRAAAVLVWVTLLASVAPALAQGELVGGYVLSIAGMARFNGGIESKTFKCSTRGSCVASVRVEVHGEAYDYFVFAKATATTATIGFSGRDRAAPELTTGSGDEIEVQRTPDGAGSQDATLMALTASRWYTSKPYTIRETLPPRLPLANVRVTVRREDAAEQNR